MSSLSSWLWGSSQLDEAIDKATSELLPTDSEDIALNLEICDQIRSKSVPAKDAMRALKRRLNHKNPNVQLLALGLTDICIKNGGDLFLTEIASREFMDNLVSILKIPVLNVDVKNKMLRLIQNWATAFEGKQSLSYVGEVYKTLQKEGYNFPPRDIAVANAAMVDTKTAPEWIDSEVCLRCRTPFSFTNRKHHCRNCGQVFDQACSSKTMPLPHFGITQDVRVCDSCHNKLSKNHERGDRKHRHSSSVHSSRNRQARQAADDDLQRAIQLSLQEAGLVSKQDLGPRSTEWQRSEPPIIDRPRYQQPSTIDEEEDPDLKAAIEASLREADAPRASAPVALETPRSEVSSFTYGEGPGYSQSYPPASIPTPALPTAPKLPNYDLEPLESDAIMTFSQTVEQVHAQGVSDLTRYPAVNELYDKANGLRPKVAMALDDTSRKERVLTDMHDKLSQAVKLYDQLLTEQLSRPKWAQPAAQSSFQQPQGYSSPYATINGTPAPNQWSQLQNNMPLGSPSHQQPQAIPSYPMSPQPTGAGVEQANWFHQNPTSQQYPQQQQQQYSQPQTYSQQQLYNQQATTQSYAQSPVSQPPQHIHPPPSELASQPVAPSSSYPIYQTPAATAPPSNVPATATPTIPHQQPQFPPSNTTSLSRSNTTYAVASPQPPLSHINLQRSNTVNYAPLHAQQVAPVPAPAPAPLPSFPTAPTVVPQGFAPYGSALPTSPPPERKEALLIDL